MAIVSILHLTYMICQERCEMRDSRLRDGATENSFKGCRRPTALTIGIDHGASNVKMSFSSLERVLAGSMPIQTNEWIFVVEFVGNEVSNSIFTSVFRGIRSGVPRGSPF